MYFEASLERPDRAFARRGNIYIPFLIFSCCIRAFLNAMHIVFQSAEIDPAGTFLIIIRATLLDLSTRDKSDCTH